MTTLLISATVATALMMLLVWLPELRERGALLRRWSLRGNGSCDGAISRVVDDAIAGFAAAHRLDGADVARLQEMKVRPGMMPVTLLLHPQLVRRAEGRFVRGRNLTAVTGGLVLIALIFPPVTGMALHHTSLWLLPLMNVAAFVAGVHLVKNAFSDLSLLNVLL